MKKYAEDLVITPLFYQQVVFVEELGEYLQENEVRYGDFCNEKRATLRLWLWS